MRVIPARIHGYLDVALATLLVAAPVLFGFSDGGAVVCWGTALVYMAMSIATDYPLGVFRFLAFSAHVAVELALAVGAALLAALFATGGFAAEAGVFAFGAVGFAGLSLLTDFESAHDFEESVREQIEAGEDYVRHHAT
jgi:hypothetical protein